MLTASGMCISPFFRFHRELISSKSEKRLQHSLINRKLPSSYSHTPHNKSYSFPQSNEWYIMQSRVCRNLNVYCMNNGHNQRLSSSPQFGDGGDGAALMRPPSGKCRMSQSSNLGSCCLDPTRHHHRSILQNYSLLSCSEARSSLVWTILICPVWQIDAAVWSSMARTERSDSHVIHKYWECTRHKSLLGFLFCWSEMESACSTACLAGQGELKGRNESYTLCWQMARQIENEF